MTLKGFLSLIQLLALTIMIVCYFKYIYSKYFKKRGNCDENIEKNDNENKE